MSFRHTKNGFTLVELIIVIVILGVLAVVAAPRFISLQADAEAAALNGFTSALVSTNQLIRAQAILQGQENLEDGSIELDDGTMLSTRFGYITFDNNTTGGDSLISVLNVDICHHQRNGNLCSADEVPDFIYDLDTIAGELVTRIFFGRRIDTDRGPDSNQIECRLDYIAPDTANESPQYDVFTSEC
ncbi:prepilin-type N-terminal cleavage/methylation domain-containing protein [Alteromonas sp. 5E99-2]|uniref:pilus assembly FimT family protein n=1 Tax=Alteromonas sp. 5E99-2 TaxID=2817683 RepID=UPI001A98C762|nr:prepilin-type N-terminal cleavage/methylation domain-containing protein [Alteromonas sp. 5E99-2]MBO1254504.1 prepilin-type N-terminal cleavage/methylation domain-containing protein [Alteromonas sp. 5E99-2]